MPRYYVTLLRLSWKHYELLTRYSGYPLCAISTFEVLVHQSSTDCSESRDLTFARSVTRKIWTSKLPADSLSTIHVK
jgi:hypothetical protein